MTKTLLTVAAGALALSCNKTPEASPPPKPERPTNTSTDAATAPSLAKPAAFDTTAFDRSCSRAADCVLVNPHKCSHCGCTNLPIAVKERDRFLAALAKYKCPPPDPKTLEIDCGGCPGYAAACKAGACAAEMR